MSSPIKSAIKIAVGSKNPVKINSVKTAFMKALEMNPIFNAKNKFEKGAQIECIGFDVPSQVSDQPMGNEETQLGAMNRATSAFKEYFSQFGSNPDFSVGLEGGLIKSSYLQIVKSNDNSNYILECFAWMVIFDGEQFGTSKTGSFPLPETVSNLVIKEGLELGHAQDKIFSTHNSKQSGGSVGLLTKGILDRTLYYQHAILLALIPFISPEIYSSSS